MTADEVRAKSEQMRIRLGYILAISGLGATAALILVLVFVKQSAATDIVAIVGLFTSVFGTVIGAFFGIQAGAAGKEAVEADKERERKGRETVEQRLQVVLAQSQPNQWDDILKRWQDLKLVQ
jgi:hypothetical protein